MAGKSGNKRSGKQNNIIPFKKTSGNPLNLNLGLLIFVVILVYVIACVVIYFRTNHIVRYEVQKGALATNKIYRGIVIRDELAVPATTAGYINFYANEGERVARGDMVYIMDETGHLYEEYQNRGFTENSLSDNALSEFRSEIITFMHGFDTYSFESAYDFKVSLHNTLKKAANVNMLDSIRRMNEDSGTKNVVSYFYAPDTGIVSLWSDGYETLTPEQVTEEMFDRNDYEERKKHILANTLMEAGDIAYKISTNEKWSIVIPIEDAERGAELENEEYIRVRFLKNLYESWGAVKLLHNADGKYYIQLSFTNSMVTFTPDRFLEIELLINDDTGLKIPNSSIVDKEFFLIPEEYVIPEGESGKGHVLRQYILESGEISSKLYDIFLYSYDKENREYYVDAAILEAGDTLYKEDGQDTFTVSRRATLTGVYNVNNGFADFKQINILAQNDEYAIVKANTQYGLCVYDYIALNASDVRDNQFIKDKNLKSQ